jgi:hypothetical protein
VVVLPFPAEDEDFANVKLAWIAWIQRHFIVPLKSLHSAKSQIRVTVGLPANPPSFSKPFKYDGTKPQGTSLTANLEECRRDGTHPLWLIPSDTPLQNGKDHFRRLDFDACVDGSIFLDPGRRRCKSSMGSFLNDCPKQTQPNSR